MAKRKYLEVRSGTAQYTLLGISTQLKDYRLSFLLNKLPAFRFTRLDDLPARIPESEQPVPFSLYTSPEDENFNTYTLLSNRSGEFFLIPAVRQTDFLLIVEGPCKKQQRDDLLKALRTVPEILLAAEINLSSLKQVEGLLSDLELHVMSTRK